MERFWNIVHYFAYKGYCKLHLISNKFSLLLYIYKNVSYCKRHFEKKGYDPEAVVNESWERPNGGISNMFADGLMIGLPIVLFTGLQLFYFMIFWDRKIPNFEIFNIQITDYQLFRYPLFVYLITTALINYLLLWHKDKYLKYFKEFDKEPRKWKIKWAWISLGVILFPFVVLSLSFVLLSN